MTLVLTGRSILEKMSLAVLLCIELLMSCTEVIPYCSSSLAWRSSSRITAAGSAADIASQRGNWLPSNKAPVNLLLPGTRSYQPDKGSKAVSAMPSIASALLFKMVPCPHISCNATGLLEAMLSSQFLLTVESKNTDSPTVPLSHRPGRAFRVNFSSESSTATRVGPGTENSVIKDRGPGISQP